MSDINSGITIGRDKLSNEVFQELNNNWNKHIKNYFNAIKYLKKRNIIDVYCFHCDNNNIILNEIYFLVLFTTAVNKNLKYLSNKNYIY